MSKKTRKDIERSWQYLMHKKRETVLIYLRFLEELPSRKIGLITLLFEGIYLDDSNRLQGKEKWAAIPHGEFILLWYLGMMARMGDLRIRYLEELDLRLWDIDKFPPNFHELQKLKRLKLKGMVSNIPPRIEELVLDEETLKNIRPWLQELTIQPKLFLEIEDPEGFIPDLFENIYGIRFVRRIEAIPYWLRNYSKLHYLRIPLHAIQKFPYWFSEFSELEELEIGPVQQGETVTLPDSLGQLIHLKKLICARLGWSELPSWVYQLKQLQKLNIAENQIEIIPRELGELSNLEHLEIQSNPLIIFPEILNHMDNLKLVLADFRQRRDWLSQCHFSLELAINYYPIGTE